MPPTSYGKVYLIHAKDNLYKIGRTTDVNRRLKELQTNSPYKLSLICYMTSICMQKLEQVLHKKFKSKRIHGEWFNLDSKDVEEIKNHPLSNLNG